MIDPFRERVYAIVAKIPSGKVMTYKQVATSAGKPHASRAVGNIMHTNKDFVRMPCHRVVRTDGTVGGYVFGTKKKIVKLKKEGVVIKGGKMIF